MNENNEEASVGTGLSMVLLLILYDDDADDDDDDDDTKVGNVYCMPL